MTEKEELEDDMMVVVVVVVVVVGVWFGLVLAVCVLCGLGRERRCEGELV